MGCSKTTLSPSSAALALKASLPQPGSEASDAAGPLEGRPPARLGRGPPVVGAAGRDADDERAGPVAGTEGRGWEVAGVVAVHAGFPGVDEAFTGQVGARPAQRLDEAPQQCVADQND